MEGAVANHDRRGVGCGEIGQSARRQEADTLGYGSAGNSPDGGALSGAYSCGIGHHRLRAVRRKISCDCGADGQRGYRVGTVVEHDRGDEIVIGELAPDENKLPVGRDGQHMSGSIADGLGDGVGGGVHNDQAAV